jgi:hypothetical protein
MDWSYADILYSLTQIVNFFMEQGTLLCVEDPQCLDNDSLYKGIEGSYLGDCVIINNHVDHVVQARLNDRLWTMKFDGAPTKFGSGEGWSSKVQQV